ncbi:MAG: hypothetical protein HN570_15810, partial [Verrucomicrobia bacterium]|nr:hypothetical protein [Verrucomicrobiota bacterium]
NCIECPEGTYSVEGKSCKNCPIGFYSEKIKSKKCLKCVIGKSTAKQTGSSTCSDVVPDKSINPPTLVSLIPVMHLSNLSHINNEATVNNTANSRRGTSFKGRESWHGTSDASRGVRELLDLQ